MVGVQAAFPQSPGLALQQGHRYSPNAMSGTKPHTLVDLVNNGQWSLVTGHWSLGANTRGWAMLNCQNCCEGLGLSSLKSAGLKLWLLTWLGVIASDCSSRVVWFRWQLTGFYFRINWLICQCQSEFLLIRCKVSPHTRGCTGIGLHLQDPSLPLLSLSSAV